MSPLTRGLLRFERLLVILSGLIVFGAVFETPGSPLDTRLEPSTLWGMLVVALALYALFASVVDSTLESIRPIRPLDCATGLYLMMFAMYVFGLMLNTAEGARNLGKAIDDSGYLAAMLVIAHLVLIPLAITSRGVGLMLFNGLQLVALAGLASEQAGVWCLAYILVAAQLAVVHHHRATLEGQRLDRGVGWGSLLRHLSWVTLTLALLMLAVLPWFPDLGGQLRLALPERSRPVDLVAAFVKLTFAFVLLVVLIRWLRRLLIDDNSTRRRQAASDEDTELMLSHPVPVATLTRRIRLRALKDARERLVDEYCWMLDRLAGRGYPRPSHQTPRELGDRVVAARPELADDVETMTRLFHVARYTERPVDRDDVDAAHLLARAIVDAAHPLAPRDQP